ncbi:hypothetical protein U1872_10355 [Sphingomonas sp. RB3P16]|uniref:hypothetical protein n=1 Tax=Parasphingomonas frigoris TaxID=3096163 RepID=UPI002FC8B6E9
MFHVDHQSQPGVLRISVRGFLAPADAVALGQAVLAGAQAARAQRADFDVLVISLGFPVQANDVADQLGRIMQRGMLLTQGRAAVVVGSQLNKLQAERTLQHPRLRVFDTIEAATGWLDMGGCDTAPLPAGI